MEVIDMKIISRKISLFGVVLATMMLSSSIYGAECQIMTRQIMTQCVSPPDPFPSPTSAAFNNGIISFTADTNGYPMITTLSVLGSQIVPFDNAGAGFQMDARSSLGNAYNPTQAGDCTGAASQLLGKTTPWSAPDLSLPSANGFMLSVTPRNYNQPGATCPGPGALLPYIFSFGTSLGDGGGIAKEVMVLDMFITRLNGSQDLDLTNSDLPSIFPLASVLPYAYWSPNGTNFYPLTFNGSNNIRVWPYLQNVYVAGDAVMLCTAGQTFCLALYSNEYTNMYISHRHGLKYELGLLSLIGNGSITDYDTHMLRRLLVVGTPSTIISAISGARAAITNWGDL